MNDLIMANQTALKCLDWPTKDETENFLTASQLENSYGIIKNDLHKTLA